MKKARTWKFLSAILFFVNTILADGLPGEYLLTERWRTFFSDISPIQNPANLQDGSYSSLRGVITLSPYDAARLFETGITIPLGFFHTAGITLAAESGKEIEDWQTEGDQFIATGIKSNHSNLMFMASYATNPWRRFITGLNVHYNYQSNFSFKPDQSIGFDVGIAYRLIYHPVLGYHKIGVTYRNIPFFEIGNLNELNNSPLLRSNYHISLLHGAIEFNFMYGLKDFTTKPDEFISGNKFNEWNIITDFTLKPIQQIGIKGYLEFSNNQDSPIRSWGLASVFDLIFLNKGRSLDIIYQFNDEMNKNIHNSHSAYFQCEFGLHREEIVARRMSRLIDLSPSDLYNRARDLYHQRNYWDAYFLFIQILTEYPDFSLNDQVTYHAGSCLEEMQMHDEAIKMYTKTKTMYPLSNIIPSTDLGLMRIYYKKGNHNAVRNQYVELNRPKVADSIRSHGAYLMGESALSNSDYSTAIREFALIQRDHPDYIFANHSQAVAYVLNNADTSYIMKSLGNCITYPASTEAQREIINRSYLLAGYMFYEEGFLGKAVSTLRNIPQKSHYYSEALLGLGWAALKAEQWDDCLTIGKKLSSSTEDIVLQSEGALIEGYAHLVRKRYDGAVEILEKALEQLSNYSIDKDSMLIKEKEHKNATESHNLLETQVVDFAKRGNLVDKTAIEQLREQHNNLLNGIDNFRKYSYNYSRALFFTKTTKTIIDDLEFMLARAKKFKSTSSTDKKLMKIQDQERKIDSELQKLREEIKNIEE